MVPNEQLLTPFLHYYLSNLYAHIRNLTGDKDRSGLNKEIIGNIHLFLPTFSIQQQIASILSSVDDKIKTEETKKKSLEELFKSMLHNLMTAKIRVNELVIPNEKNK
jgi:type I restriction enzyme S subunit